MDNSIGIIEYKSSNFEFEFQDQDESLAGQEDFEILNLGSSPSIIVDTLSKNFSNRNAEKQKIPVDANKMVSLQEFDVTPITIDIPNFSTDVFDSQTNEAESDPGKTIPGNLV